MFSIEVVIAFVVGAVDILAVFAGLVYLIIKLITNPLRDAISSAEAEITAVKGSGTATPLGQKVHDLAGKLQEHLLADEKRFGEMQTELKEFRDETRTSFEKLLHQRPRK